MAFPSTTGTVPITLEAAWEGARSLAAAVKSQSQALLSSAQGTGISADQIVAYSAMLANAVTLFNQYAAVSGLAAYAQAQIGSSTENIATDFTTMVNAVQSTIAWIVANFPKDANGNLLYVQLSAAGTVTHTVFSVSQLAGFVTVLQALLATIN